MNYEKQIVGNEILKDEVDDHSEILTESQMSAIEEGLDFDSLVYSENPQFIDEETIYDVWV